MFSNIEIAGLILIALGALYQFLKAMGKFSAPGKEGEETEIESKVFTLKGGPGIILVGLGVLLFIIGAVQNPTLSSPTQVPSPEVYPTATETSTKLETSTNMITYDYLLGKWSKSDRGLALTFYSDSSYLLQDLSESSYITGTYELSGSKLVFISDSGGAQDSYPVSYIDVNTFKLGDAVYYRATTETPNNVITSDYLIGNWSATTSEWTTVLIFRKNGIFGAGAIDSNTGKKDLFSGDYLLTDSTLTLNYDDGTKQSFSLTYIDRDTVKLNDITYTRIIE